MRGNNKRVIEYLQYLGLEYDIDDYESRFVIQKTVFILVCPCRMNLLSGKRELIQKN